MAFRDIRSQLTHFTIVYAGPPTSGKTESVRTLSQELRRVNAVQSPEEYNGRTMFFDWLEYTGGYFMGGRLRCQIITVPGQRGLLARREQLLELADAVVFVVNSRAAEVDNSRPYLDEVREILQRRRYPVGLIVQCNQQDRKDALPPDEIRERLGLRESENTYPTVATQGEGVRQSFLMGLRLAIDRAQQMHSAGERLAEHNPFTDSGELLDHMQSEVADGQPDNATEDSGINLPEPTLNTVFDVPLPAANDNESAVPPADPFALLDASDETPEPPAAEPVAVESDEREETPNTGNTNGTATIAPISTAAASTAEQTTPSFTKRFSRMVWPPVTGRAMLYRLEQAKLPSYAVPNSWGWELNAAGWRLFTAPHLCVKEEYGARVQLFHLGRKLLAAESLIAANRCFAISEDNQQNFWIWEIIAPQSQQQQALPTWYAAADEAQRKQCLDLLAQETRSLVLVDYVQPLSSNDFITDGKQLRISTPLLQLLQTDPLPRLDHEQLLTLWQQQLNIAL